MKEDLLKKVKEALGEIEPSAEIYLYESFEKYPHYVIPA
jgi:hypothetical protein